MRSEEGKSGRFSRDAQASSGEIRHSRRFDLRTPQKRRNAAATPGIARIFNHTQMFDVSLKATGL
jgi:hypothetical protein